MTMQSLPSIRLVQENDKSLVTKINSTLVNTVPLWETQLAQAVTIQRSAEAARAVKEASDLTNESLTSNAANLRESNKIVREEMERGVFDIEVIKKANADLIATVASAVAVPATQFLYFWVRVRSTILTPPIPRHWYSQTFPPHRSPD